MIRRRGHPKRYGGPWYGNDVQRTVFERGAKRHFPALQCVTRTGGPRVGRNYDVLLDVPHYEERRVEILFPRRAPTRAEISADGPSDSPHRYGDGHLCIWYPDDPPGQKWVFEDGLLVLIGMTTAHLFREAWWRETGEWLGPEVGHSPVEDRRERRGQDD